MAAGRLYKNYSHNYKEGSHHPRNGFHPKSYSQFHDLSGTERHNDRSHSHRRKDEYRVNPQPGYSFYKEDRAHRISEKKRKISPVVWDTRNEKQVRVPSTNGISVPALPKTLKVPDFVIDAMVRRIHPVEPRAMLTGSDGVGVPISLTDCYVATSQELLGDDDEEMGQIEEGEYVEENIILKSKGVDLDDAPRTVPETKLSSLGVGEFNGGGCEENGDITPVAVEAGHFMGLASPDEQIENELNSDNVSVISDEESPGVSPGELTSEDDDDCSEAYEGRRYGILPCSRGVFEYERIKRISEGTYGVVFKARDKKTGEIVALKKVKVGNKSEGFPVTALREINILTSLKHPSIVEVKEVATDDFDGVYMVMEYVDYELKDFMESMKHPFSQSEVKCLMKQLLEGLSYLHDNWVLHRDLKTSNLLLNKSGEMKICDFGMARQYGSPSKPYTPLVVTLWYRAPEILLGAKQYSTAIDMWSVGCIMAELLARKPLFDGNKELEQLQKIFKTLGTPDEKIWHGYSSLPGAKVNVVKQPYNNLRKMFPAVSFNGGPVLTELGFDLLSKLLTYDPEKRITARDALSHPWFAEFPLPVERISTFR